MKPKKRATKGEAKSNRYTQIIEAIFKKNYQPGANEVVFDRSEFEHIARTLGINLPKNLGDIIYSFRYRVTLPESIRSKETDGKHWIIRPKGRAKYAFVLVSEHSINPNPLLAAIKIPESTPGIVAKYALGDEQALLARLRYNRLIDINTGVACYSIQNHLRTFLPGIGQVETDELYVGIDKDGAHYVFPIQAKGGKDKLSLVQIEQDFALCANKFPNLKRVAIGAYFNREKNLIALFQFNETPEGVKLRSEHHYQLVPPAEVTPDLLKLYKESLPSTNR
jgi:hypothetical protein